MDPLLRLTKRQRLDHPLCWMDCETIETVVAPVAMSTRDPLQQQPLSRHFQTPIASPLTEEIFLDRLQKEILTPFRFSLSDQIQLLDNAVDTVPSAKLRRQWLQSRLRVGLNACLRLLEDADAPLNGNPARDATVVALPTLVVITSEATTSASSTAAHYALAMLAHQVGTPLLVLPTTSSRDLGRRLGTKHVTAMAFVGECQNSPDGAPSGLPPTEQDQVHTAVASFVAFVRDKIPQK